MDFEAGAQSPSGVALPGPSRRSSALRTLARLVYIAAIIAVARSVVADWNDVPTGSMRPTILEGDRIVVNKLAYGLRVPFTHLWLATWGGPSRGDVVTFASPADGTRMVKRIVGVPGDRVRLDNNALYINDAPVVYDLVKTRAFSPAPDGTMLPVVVASESLPRTGSSSDNEDAESESSTWEHSIQITPGLPSLRNFSDLVVPEGSYFVMGDNRDLSSDSRLIGFVPRERVYGRCTFTAVSFDPAGHLSTRSDRWFLPLQ